MLEFIKKYKKYFVFCVAFAVSKLMPTLYTFLIILYTTIAMITLILKKKEIRR